MDSSSDIMEKEASASELELKLNKMEAQKRKATNYLVDLKKYDKLLNYEKFQELIRIGLLNTK